MSFCNLGTLLSITQTDRYVTPAKAGVHYYDAGIYVLGIRGFLPSQE